MGFSPVGITLEPAFFLLFKNIYAYFVYMKGLAGGAFKTNEDG